MTELVDGGDGVTVTVLSPPAPDGLVTLRLDFVASGAAYRIDAHLGYNASIALVQLLIAAAKEARP